MDIHETAMARFVRDGIVSDHALTLDAFPGGIRMQGDIACRGGIVISVDKILDTVGEDSEQMVQTATYSYNASIRGYNAFLRNDNAHLHPGHIDPHHRHEYDWERGDEMPGSPLWVGADRWPTLGQFIEEVDRWYWEHRDVLPDPDAEARLGLSHHRGRTSSTPSRFRRQGNGSGET